MTRPLPELLSGLLVDRRHLVRQRVPLDDLAARVAGVVAEPGPPEHAVVAARTAQGVVEAVRFAGRHGLTVSQQEDGAGAGRRPARRDRRARRVRRAPAGLGPGRRRCDLAAGAGGGRPVRARRAQRPEQRERRRPRHARRARPDGPHVRPGLGPGARPGGDRGRRAAPGHADRAPRPVLRPARRRGRAGRRHGARARPGAAAAVLRRRAALRHRRRRRGARALAHLVGRPARSFATTWVALLDGTVVVRFLWTGAAADGEQALREMRSVAPVRLDDVAERPYAAVDEVHADPVPGHEGAALLLLPAEAVAALLAVAGSGQVQVELRQLGGATARPRRAPQRVLPPRRRVRPARGRRRRRPRRRGAGAVECRGRS